VHQVGYFQESMTLNSYVEGNFSCSKNLIRHKRDKKRVSK